MQLGERQFTDGSTQPVFRSDDGRQFVRDDDGEAVYGSAMPEQPVLTRCSCPRPRFGWR